jgi:NADPH:quinone reductase
MQSGSRCCARRRDRPQPVTAARLTYAAGEPLLPVPFWELLFKNVRVFFLGSDDFPPAALTAAARELNAALEAGWPGFEIGRRFPLQAVAEAHEYLEGQGQGWVVVAL